MIFLFRPGILIFFFYHRLVFLLIIIRLRITNCCCCFIHYPSCLHSLHDLCISFIGIRNQQSAFLSLPLLSQQYAFIPTKFHSILITFSFFAITYNYISCLNHPRLSKISIEPPTNRLRLSPSASL